MENPAAEELTEHAEEAEFEAAREHPARVWIERWVVLLLGLATIATSWAAYQEVRWDGQERNLRQEAGRAETESSAAYVRGYSEAAYDSAWFVRFAEAYYDGNAELQALYTDDLMRPELKPYLDQWLAADPQANPEAPKTPFTTEAYQQSLLADSTRFASTADTKLHEANEVQETSDRYVALTVVITSVLFLAGLSGTQRAVRLRVAMLAIGTVILSAVVVILLTMPVR
jgi:hypothetical protein